MSGQPAIRARGLVRRYGALRVLRGLDLEIPRGACAAMFGPNGAGKSTLLNVLCGMLRPHDGSVEVLGQALPAGPDLRARLGIVGHDAMVYGDLSARENLEYYRRLYRLEDAERPAAMLARVRLEHAADRPVRTFSRGMLQRLSLARALQHEPELLLLDEPFTGLDPAGSDVLVELLAELRARKVTVVLTTHDFERALAAADHAVVLSGGRVVWQRDGTVPAAAEMQRIYHEVA